MVATRGLWYPACLLCIVSLSSVCVLIFVSEHIRDSDLEDKYIHERDSNGKRYEERLWDAVNDPARERPVKTSAVIPQQTIAVCVSTTSRGLLKKAAAPTNTNSPTASQLLTLPLFKMMLPSLVHTLEQGFEYWVYIAYDNDDTRFAATASADTGSSAAKSNAAATTDKADNTNINGVMQLWLQQNVHTPLQKRGIKVQVVWLPFLNQLRKPGPASTTTKIVWENRTYNVSLIDFWCCMALLADLQLHDAGRCY